MAQTHGKQGTGHPAHGAETAPLHDPTDAWHGHSKDERPQEEHGEIRNPGLIMGIGFALFLGVVAAVVAVDGFYKWFSSQRLAKNERAVGTNAPAFEARAFKAEALTVQQGSEGTWKVIPGAGEVPPRAVAVIPLKHAIGMVESQYAAKLQLAGGPEGPEAAAGGATQQASGSGASNK